MSVLKVEMRADALVRLMRSDALLNRAEALVAGAIDADVEAVRRAFIRRGWEDDGRAVPERGHRILEWLADLRPEL